MRKVTRAKLHDLQIVIPGIGSLGNDYPLKGKSQLDSTLVEGPNGLELTIKGTPGTAIIPYANVQMYITAPDDAEVSQAKSKK